MRIEPENDKEDLERLEGKIDRIASEVAKINRHFFWQKVFGVVKTLLIVIPLVVGAIWLYPIVNDMYTQTQALIKQADGLLKLTK